MIYHICIVILLLMEPLTALYLVVSFLYQALYILYRLRFSSHHFGYHIISWLIVQYFTVLIIILEVSLNVLGILKLLQHLLKFLLVAMHVEQYLRLRVFHLVSLQPYLQTMI